MCELDNIIKWFNLAKDSKTGVNGEEIDSFTPDDAAFSQLVDLWDKTAYIATCFKGVSLSDDFLDDLEINLSYALEKHYSTEDSSEILKNLDREELCAVLCKHIFTAVGVGVLLGFDMKRALEAVVESEYTNLTTNKSGRVVALRGHTGEFAKNLDTYEAPDLKSCV